MQVDWNLVASQLDISNGHAARMRFSRFRQHMEGITTVPRAARPKKPSTKESSKLGKFAKGEERPKKRPASSDFIKEEPPEPSLQMSSPPVKREPGPDPMLSTLPTAMSPSGLVPASGNSLSTAPPSPPYPLLTVAPADLALNQQQQQHQHYQPFPDYSQPQYPPIPSLNPPVSFNPFMSSVLPSRPEPTWAPVKIEPREGGLDDIFVKVEPSME